MNLNEYLDMATEKRMVVTIEGRLIQKGIEEGVIVVCPSDKKDQWSIIFKSFKNPLLETGMVATFYEGQNALTPTVLVPAGCVKYVGK